MRSVRLASLFAAAGLLAAAVPTGPAAAAPEPRRWSLARCVQAALSTVTYEPEVEYFTVAGTATQCEAPAATAVTTGFGVATFSPPGYGGLIRDWTIRAFPAPAGAWQPVTVPFGVAAVRAIAGRHAVCVVQRPAPAPGTPVWVTTPPVPVACLEVTVSVPEEGDPVAAAAPLPADAPLVRAAIQVPATFTGAVAPYHTADEEDDGEGTGNCGTCF
jgi:hypothetical protein